MDVSIDEANAIRASLGMKPLPGGSGPIFKQATSAVEEEEDLGSTLESRQEEGYENYRKLKEAEKKKADREARNEAIKKEREAAARKVKLTGRGLGDADGEDVSAKSWLISQKKRQKEIDLMRKRRLEEEEEEARAIAQYTAKDLAGVRVGHEVDSFAEGQEQVLTLKDTTIDENEEEGDELESTQMRDQERLERNLNLKKKKPVYNPNDMEESGQVKILAQYDEEIDGEKRSRFTLDGLGSTTEQAEAIRNGQRIPAKAKPISLDFLKDEQPASDYLDTSEVKIKKPKKKKTKSTRQRVVDDDDFLAQPSTTDVIDDTEVDQPAPTTQKRAYNNSFVDDEDLQATLAAQRRAALKKRKRIRPEDIAKQLREEADMPKAEDDDNKGGLVIDETSEFVANIQKPVEEEIKRPRVISRPAEERQTAMNDESDEDGDVDMDRSYANVEDEEDLKDRIKREEELQQAPSTGIEEEATITEGVGATLRLLRERAILKDAGTGDLNAEYRKTQLFLAEKQRLEAEAERKARLQREKDRQNGRMNNMSAKDKEEYARNANNQRDYIESRQLADLFNREYKPNVNIKYTDEHGRDLNVKEAFKELSHQFHGKGSGKLKTEKLLKRIATEKEREAKSLLDGSGSGGMSGVATTQTMAKKNRQAGVRLG